jgi:hypothetical protein
MRIKAQTSIELIVILSLMLSIFIVIVVSNNNMLSTSTSRLNQDKANSALDDISNAANSVYQQGTGAKTRVYVSVPQSAFNSTVFNKTIKLQMYVKGQRIQTVYRLFDFDINGTLPNSSGSYWVDVEAYDSYVNMSY